MAVSNYRHGVTWRDIPTSIVAPVIADSGVPFIVGSAPVQQIENPPLPNRPRVYFNYEDAVKEMGYSDDWRSYTLCQSIYTYFALFNVGPIILSYVNDIRDAVFQDPAAVVDDTFTFIKGKAGYISKGIIPNTLAVASAAAGAGDTYVYGDDYIGAWQNDPLDGVLRYSLMAVPGGAIDQVNDDGFLTNVPVFCSFTNVRPMAVTKSHIIGGFDLASGTTTGIEVVEDVFPLHRIVPGIIQAPFWSQDPEVAAVMAAKADEINGCFRCTTLTDIDSSTVTNPMDVNIWKDLNNYVDKRQGALWPRVGIGDRDIWLSTEYGARMQLTDRDNNNVPVETPSNKTLRMTKTLVGSFDGGLTGAPLQEVVFSKAYGDMLNGQGILTAINWLGGWKSWGSNMACYPGISDPKDRWMPLRRMTDWLGNTLVLTFFQKVDKPGNRRLIDSIIDTANVWLNGLVSEGNCLGARVEFRHDENPDTNLIDGHYVFHVYEAFPIPAEWIEFILEFDISYLQTLYIEA
jgi:Bacteriophage tail sheath protein